MIGKGIKDNLNVRLTPLPSCIVVTRFNQSG
jgi:hypothetical protein